MSEVVGVDLSLTSTGVCTDEVVESFGYGLRNDAPQHDRMERILKIASQVYRHCKGARLVVIEEAAFSKSTGHAHERAELAGVVKASLYQRGIPFAMFNTRRLKKYATDDGNADKGKMLESAVTAAQVFNHRMMQNADEADAFWLWHAGTTQLRLEENTLSPAAVWVFRLKVLEAVAWPLMSNRKGEQ